MFGIGFWEMIVIAVLALLAVGPDRLPSMIKTVLRLYRQIQRSADELRSSSGIDELLRDEELKELAELRKQKIALLDREARGSEKAPRAPEAAEPSGARSPSSAAPATAHAEATTKRGGPGGGDDAMLGAAVPVARGIGAVLPFHGTGTRSALEERELARELPVEGADLALARRREPDLDTDEARRVREAAIASKLAARPAEEPLAAGGSARTR